MGTMRQPLHLGAALRMAPRMGSFTSAPKIANEDQADCDLEMEQQRSVTREELLARCREELRSLPPQLKRNFTGRYQEQPGPETVRVLQWNLLSQALAEQADGFACCPDAALDWSKRRWRILEEILSYQPDVVCLQEVDHYKFLSASLGSVGFDGTFYPKPDSPCCYVRGNNGPDGCAIFYDRAKFELLRCEKRVLEVFTCQSNQVTLLCIFRRKLDDAELCLVTTHLKARQGGLLSSLRNEQGKDLLDFVRAHRGRRPVIIAGDFNAEPSEPVYRTLMAQRDLPLESSYAVRPGSGGVREEEPPYTTWKIRREGEVCHTIDYIFYTRPDFELEARLDFPTEDQIGPGRVPSLAYASDHFSLVADLALPFRISDQQVNELLNEEGSHRGTAS
ncbi:NADP/NADPH phosphatase nocturnin isoform X2 [Dermacentor variabilis]|uniref:NADP/NADPH phosphatase nocturnin isoform X2 n=1 Tax=Dermacentor variabilis TaxID=34621 RepID=UPI003F5C290D